MSSISTIMFDEMAEAIQQTLAPRGFVFARSERNGPFGSHYSEFANGSRAYRVVWDGKESWLLAEVTEKYQDAPVKRWSDIALFPLGRFGPVTDFEVVSQGLIHAVATHVAS